MHTEKQRHGCLTAWLVLMILSNGFLAISFPLGVEDLKREMPGFPEWIVWPVAVLSVVNVICAIALLNWKKWGFYGFVVSNLIAFAMNLYAGIGILQTFAGLAGIAILYGVLQIGAPRSGWAQMGTKPEAPGKSDL